MNRRNPLEGERLAFHEKYYQHSTNVMFIKRVLIKRRSTKIVLSAKGDKLNVLPSSKPVPNPTERESWKNMDSKESAGRGYGTVPSKVSLCVCANNTVDG